MSSEQSDREIELFWSKVSKTESCWEWTGAHSKGYGIFSVPGKSYRAHRYAYERLVGPIETGLVLDHLCRNRGCVNPAHLEPVSNRQNVLRGIGITAQLAVRDKCARGHEMTDENTKVRSDGYRRCRKCITIDSGIRRQQLGKQPCPECGQVLWPANIKHHREVRHSMLEPNA